MNDAFAIGLSTSASEAEHLNNNEYQTICGKNSIDEEEAIKLLCDYGISENKAKLRLQVTEISFIL